MSVLIVGGDKIDRLAHALTERGLGPVEHWNGRKPGTLHRKVPRGVELVVVVWHQVNHMLLKKVREQAERQGVPVLYTRHSSSARGDALAATASETVELAARWLGAADEPRRATACGGVL